MNLKEIRKAKKRASDIVRREQVRLAKTGHEHSFEKLSLAVGIHPMSHGEYGLAVRVKCKTDISEHLIKNIREATGVSEEEFDYREIDEINFLSNSLATFKQLTRPLKPGLSIGQSIDQKGSGTLGMFVGQKECPDIFILSCAHVIASPRAVIDQSIVQPGCPYGGKRDSEFCIARLASYSSPSTQRMNTIDAAVAKLKNQKQSLDMHTIPKIGRIMSITDEVEESVDVRKFGCESGLTTGKISAIELEFGISVPNSHDEMRFESQFEIEPSSSVPFAIPGDSGSIVVDKKNRAVGLLFASSRTGYGYANPMHLVFDELNLELID